MSPLNRPAVSGVSPVGSTRAGILTSYLRLQRSQQGGPQPGGPPVDTRRSICHHLYTYDLVNETVIDLVGPLLGGNITKSFQSMGIEQSTLNAQVGDPDGRYAEGGSARATLLQPGTYFTIVSTITSASGTTTANLGVFVLAGGRPALNYDRKQAMLQLRLENWMGPRWRMVDGTLFDLAMLGSSVRTWTMLQEAVFNKDALVGTISIPNIDPATYGAILITMTHYLQGEPSPQRVHIDGPCSGIAHLVDYPDIVVGLTHIPNKPLTWYSNPNVQPWKQAPKHNEVVAFYEQQNWVRLYISYDGRGHAHFMPRRGKVYTGMGWSCDVAHPVTIQLPVDGEGGIKPQRGPLQYGAVQSLLYIFWPAQNGQPQRGPGGTVVGTQGATPGSFVIELREAGLYASANRVHPFEVGFDSTEQIRVRGDGSKPGLGLGPGEPLGNEGCEDKVHWYQANADKLNLAVSADFLPPLLGTDFYIYSPKSDHDGYYKLVGVNYPLAAGVATYDLMWSSDT